MTLRAYILIALLLACGVARGQYADCPGGACPIPPGYGPQPYQAQPQPYNTPPINVSPSQEILNSVVRVHAGGYAGSGTVVAVENGHALVISCNHIFSGGTDNLSVGFRHGTTRSPAVLVDRDAGNDLSAWDVSLGLQANPQPVPVSSSDPTAMEVCTSVGWGSGSLAYFNGRWSGIFGNTQEIYGSVRQGDSGGPILNSKWEVCGTIIGTDSIQRSTIITASRCQPLRDFIARVKAKWAAAWSAPVPAKPGELKPVPAKPQPDAPLGDIAEIAGGWGITAGLASLGIGGVPALIVGWLGRRALHKAVAAVEAKHAAKAESATLPAPVIYQGMGCKWQPPAPVAPSPAPQAAPQVAPGMVGGGVTHAADAQPLAAPAPVQVTNYSLSDAYANELAKKRQHEGMSIPQEALMGQLYKEAVMRLRTGEFGLLPANREDFAGKIQNWVNTEFMRRHGVQLS